MGGKVPMRPIESYQSGDRVWAPAQIEGESPTPWRVAQGVRRDERWITVTNEDGGSRHLELGWRLFRTRAAADTWGRANLNAKRLPKLSTADVLEHPQRWRVEMSWVEGGFFRIETEDCTVVPHDRLVDWVRVQRASGECMEAPLSTIFHSRNAATKAVGFEREKLEAQIDDKGSEHCRLCYSPFPSKDREAKRGVSRGEFWWPEIQSPIATNFSRHVSQ